jgi:3-dehydroquinate dehydratase II
VNIHIINGPNLNLLGIREPETYGNRNMEDCLESLRNEFKDININYFQNNVEGEIINHLQEIGFTSDGIIINPGAYTHTSVAIADALRAISTQAVEVHISNIFSREEYRKAGITTASCIGSISGFGLNGYRMALLHFIK